MLFTQFLRAFYAIFGVNLNITSIVHLTAINWPKHVVFDGVTLVGVGHCLERSIIPSALVDALRRPRRAAGRWFSGQDRRRLPGRATLEAPGTGSAESRRSA